MNNNIWATVTHVQENCIKVRFDSGEDSKKLYRYPKGQNPNVGDRAFFICDVCVGIY